MLKIYIELNLVNSFIITLKFTLKISILLVNRLDESFWLYINFQGINNLALENTYLVPLIGESLIDEEKPSNLFCLI